nr:hypothetical protein [Herbidospora cretacea]
MTGPESFLPAAAGFHTDPSGARKTAVNSPNSRFLGGRTTRAPAATASSSRALTSAGRSTTADRTWPRKPDPAGSAPSPAASAPTSGEARAASGRTAA